MKLILTGHAIFYYVVLLNSFGRSNSKSQILCRNNGSIAQDEFATWCDCPHPFTGRYCEDVACLNGLSTGYQYDPTSFFFNKRCLCDPGWTGELCDKSLINRCGENGEDRGGKCVCRQNFAGDRCQHVTKCIHGQLFNGRCACHYGWSGDFCDVIICHHGTPTEDYNSCICPSRYRGRYCDFCAEPASSPPPECAAIGKGVTNVSSDSMPILFAVIITLGIVALFVIIYFICHKVKELQNENMTVRQRRRDIEGNQSPNTTQHETEALNLPECLTKPDDPPKYEDIVPSNSNYLPTSLAVIGDSSYKTENNFHQNKSIELLQENLQNKNQGIYETAEMASFVETVQENSEIVPTTLNIPTEDSALVPCDGENKSKEIPRKEEIPLPFAIADNNSGTELRNNVLSTTYLPSIQPEFKNSCERENEALLPNLCNLQNQLDKTNQLNESLNEIEAKDIVPGNCNYLPSSLPVIGDGSYKSENNFHQNKSIELLQENLQNKNQGIHETAEMASFTETVRENSGIVPTTLNIPAEDSAFVPCDGENKSKEIPLPFTIADNNSEIEHLDNVSAATSLPSIQNKISNSPERENIASLSELCNLQNQSENTNQSHKTFEETEAKVGLEMMQQADLKPP